MTAIADPRAERCGRVHAVLAPMLVVLAPLVDWGAGGLAGHLSATLLLLVGWGTCCVEWALGLRDRMRFTFGGLIAGGLWSLLALRAGSAPDPAQAWALVGGWAWVGLWAWYLMQVAERLRSALIAALVAVLAVQLVIALMQAAVVLPAIESAVIAGDERVTGLVDTAGSRPLLLERLREGGAYGSFTIANLLASWCLLVGLPLAAWVWQLRRRFGDAVSATPAVGPSVLMLVLILATVACLIEAGARGPIVAAALALALAWCAGGGGRRRWRWAAVASGGAIGLALLSWWMPASLAVRLGYWRAAVYTAGDRPLLGHGPGAFAELGRQYLRVGDEFSRYVHDAPLAAWVAGGAMALVATAVVLGRWVLAPLRTADDETASASTTGPEAVALPSLVAIGAAPLLAVLGGALGDEHVTWWPGGPALQLVWALVLSLVAVWVAIECRRLPPPPPRAWSLGLACFALASLIDFQWQEVDVLATAVVVAVLIGPARITHRRRLILGLGAVVLAGGLVAHILAAAFLTAADRFDERLAELDASAEADGGLDQAALAEVAAQLPSWPEDPDRLFRLAVRIEPPVRRIAALQAFLDVYPHDDRAWSALAAAAVAAGDLQMAVQAMREAVDRYPARLDRRARLVELARAMATAGQRSEAVPDPAALAAEHATWIAAHRDRASHSHGGPAVPAAETPRMEASESP